MAKVKEIYICSQCGTQFPQWKGQCTNCQEWNTINASTVATKTAKSRSKIVQVQDVMSLQDVNVEEYASFASGIDALDKILGNGFVPGAAILVGGEPGIGKSTLLLQLAGAVASGASFGANISSRATSNTVNSKKNTEEENKNRLVLYASGEESLQQIKGRAERLGVLHPNLLAITTSNVQDIIQIIESHTPDLLIVDSIQTLTSDLADGLPGNVSQVKACATELVEKCKKHHCTLVLVGHVTKEGDLAGPRLLEHLVDTVISLEGDRRQVFRILRVLKNRFGPNQDLLVFQMVKRGLEVIEDPSTYFLGTRDATLSGTAVVMAVDGQRPLAVEMQALVTKTYLAIPRRTGLGFDVNRLHLLLAVLEKRLRLNFGQVDIYAKVGGGIRLQEPGLDLALVAAVLSSFYDIPLPERAVFWGEVDLNGQIRQVSMSDIRLKQAERLGYNPIFCPDGKRLKTVADLQNMLFRK